MAEEKKESPGKTAEKTLSEKKPCPEKTHHQTEKGRCYPNERKKAVVVLSPIVNEIHATTDFETFKRLTYEYAKMLGCTVNEEEGESWHVLLPLRDVP
jgi:hypothetical protein